MKEHGPRGLARAAADTAASGERGGSGTCVGQSVQVRSQRISTLLTRQAPVHKIPKFNLFRFIRLSAYVLFQA